MSRPAAAAALDYWFSIDSSTYRCSSEAVSWPVRSEAGKCGFSLHRVAPTLTLYFPRVPPFGNVRPPERLGWKIVWLWFALVLSAVVYVSMARLWTDTSMPRLEGAEATLLRVYGKVCFVFRALLRAHSPGVVVCFLPVWRLIFGPCGCCVHTASLMSGLGCLLLLLLLLRLCTSKPPACCLLIF